MTTHERNQTTDSIATRLRGLRDEGAAPYDWTEFKRKASHRAEGKPRHQASPRHWNPAANRSAWNRTERHRVAIAAAVALIVVSVALWNRIGVGDPVAKITSSTSNDPANRSASPDDNGVTSDAHNEIAANAGGIPLTQGDSRETNPARDNTGASPHARQAAKESAELRDVITSDTANANSLWLASLPAEPAITRLDTRVAVVDLEDHIAWIDDLLNTVQAESAQSPHIRTLQRERAQLIASLAKVRYVETLAAQR